MTAIAAVQDADRDLIVVHGRMAVLFGNVYVLRQVLAEDEPEGRRITFINTGDFLGCLAEIYRSPAILMSFSLLTNSSNVSNTSASRRR